VFSLEERSAARDRILTMASADTRIVAGAVVGSFASGTADRWSDLDLAFAVADDVAVGDVLADWTLQLATSLGAVGILDLPVGTSIYRVFLLQGALQVDLSFTPARQFRPAGPAFALLFGESGKPAYRASPPPRHFFGLGTLHAMHARTSLERGRQWRAEHSITGIRECALSLVCIQRGLEPFDGRGFDDLPADILVPFIGTLAGSVQPLDLRRALSTAVDLLLAASADVPDLASEVETRLRTLVI